MHPLSPSWLVLMSRRRLHVDGVDDELWGRFFTLAKGDGRAKLKSSLKVVDADDNGGPLFQSSTSGAKVDVEADK